MRLTCTKCDSEEVYIVMPKQEKILETQTIDEMLENIHKPVNLIYKPITYACKKCGYSVSR
jgi:hypothetical protein